MSFTPLTAMVFFLAIFGLDDAFVYGFVSWSARAPAAITEKEIFKKKRQNKFIVV